MLSLTEPRSSSTRPRHIGYDLTDTKLVRLDGSPHRIIASGELRCGLAAAGLTDAAVRVSARDHLMRFRATRRAG